MTSFSLQDLFRPFLETRAPALFLVGSIALAILGNAIYELLTSTLGASPATLIALIVSAVLVFAFVALGFRRIVRALETRRNIGPVAPDRQADPYPGLILNVGLSKPGPERAIIQWHARNGMLEHCWLIVTPQVKQKAVDKLSDLRHFIEASNALPHIIEVDDALQVDQIYKTMRGVLQVAAQMPKAQPLIADITGGNKPMTAGLLLACLESQTAMQYWHVPRDARGEPLVTQEATAMQIVVQPPPSSKADDATADA